MLGRRFTAVLPGMLLVVLGAAYAHADTVLTGANSSLVLSPDGSATIINRSTYAPKITQSATNENVNDPGSAGSSGTGTTVTSGPTNSSSAQGISNVQNAGIESGGGTTIINRSNFAPSITQNATNINENATSGADPGSGDVFNTGSTSTSNAQGINNTQNAALIIGSPGGTTIINRSNFTPNITENVTNVNENAPAGPGGGSGDTFNTGSTSTSNAQGINNTQNAALIIGSGGGTTIINRSNFAPSITENAVNVNDNGAGGGSGGGGSGDVFTTGSTNTSNAQGINNTQGVTLNLAGGVGGALIVNGASFTPAITQGATNVNANDQLLLSGL